MSKEEDIIIGKRINELRTSQQIKLTMEKFGERLGVQKSAINKLEKGQNHLTDTMIKTICHEFNVNEEWLRNGSGDMFLIPEDKTAAAVERILTNKDDVIYKSLVSFVDTYEQLSPSSKKALQDFAIDWLENIKKDREA